MAITINIYYCGKNGNARKFAKEMIDSGIVNAIRSENGNVKYDYFYPVDDCETVLLIDSWADQQALDAHHESPYMAQIMALRTKYNLTMRVERYCADDDSTTENDKKYILK